MKNKLPSTASLIITAVAIIIVVVLLVYAKKPTPVAAPSTAPGALCYVLNTPTSTGYDVAYLKLTTMDGGAHIIGEMGTSLAQKNKESGTLQGSITNDNGTAVFDGQYSNTGEGMSTVDEQLIRLDDTQAQIGYGENQKNADGSYSYIDKTAVTYSLTLPAVDCAQYYTLKAAALTR